MVDFTARPRTRAPSPPINPNSPLAPELYLPICVFYFVIVFTHHRPQSIQTRQSSPLWPPTDSLYLNQQKIMISFSPLCGRVYASERKYKLKNIAAALFLQPLPADLEGLIWILDNFLYLQRRSILTQREGNSRCVCFPPFVRVWGCATPHCLAVWVGGLLPPISCN